jgi:N-acetyl-anhydromuramyl-L-alanine amidase AmpD
VNAIVVRGCHRPIDAIVHTWVKTGLHFTCRMRPSRTRWIVNHWTGSENPPETLHRNMKNAVNSLTKKPEPKSVHFAVDALGEIYQFADTDARCAHAKAHHGNSISIGIEFICRGDDDKMPSRGIVRERQSDIIHGAIVTYDDLTAAQIAAGVELNEVLCAEYKIPLAVPRRGNDVYSTELPLSFLARFHGCVGHYMLEKKKRDPGLSLMRAIDARARALQPPPTPPRVA